MPLSILIAYGIFFTLMGACVGSFLNVVIWRLPNRGHEVAYLGKKGRMTLSWPPSHCPMCDTPIRWYQNIPILSWVALRAKCASCKAPIPVRYPLVELGTAFAFLALYVAYFVLHLPILANVPGPVFSDVRQDWPAYVLHLVFIASLFAASAIDADLYIIPLSIPYMLLILGLAANPFINSPVIPRIDGASPWALPVLGAVVGVLLANLLMVVKILPRSFAEPPAAPGAPATDHVAKAEADVPIAAADESASVPKVVTPQEQLPPPPKLTRFGVSLVVTAVLIVGAAICWAVAPAKAAGITGLSVAIVIFLLGVLPRDAGQVDVTDEVMEEINADNVRSEVAKESLFIAIPILCAIGAYFLPITLPASPPLERILGTLAGALAGGGVVWFVRIGGTMAFNKEAMGMGDAHLLVGIGAIIGAPLVVLTFFFAPFIGILWAIFLKLLGKPNVLPYGPWLSVAAILNLIVGSLFLTFYASVLWPPQ